jgi:hypothetical protein
LYDLAPSKSTFIKNGFWPLDAQKKYFFFTFFLDYCRKCISLSNGTLVDEFANKNGPITSEKVKI